MIPQHQELVRYSGHFIHVQEKARFALCDEHMYAYRLHRAYMEDYYKKKKKKKTG